METEDVWPFAVMPNITRSSEVIVKIERVVGRSTEWNRLEVCSTPRRHWAAFVMRCGEGLARNVSNDRVRGLWWCW